MHPTGRDDLAWHETQYDRRLQRAIDWASAVVNDELIARSMTDLLDQGVAQTAAEPVAIDFDRVFSNSYELPSHPPGNLPDESLRGALVLELLFPFTGAGSALETGLKTYGDEGEVVVQTMLAAGAEPTSDQISKWRADAVDHLSAKVAEANAVIGAHRTRVRAEIEATLGPRWRRARAIDQALTDQQIPVERPSNPSVPMPLGPSRMTVARANTAADRGEPEWVVADDLAEHLLSLIAGFSSALERLPETAGRLSTWGEESLRDVLLFILNANVRGQATGETFIQRGKADLVLRWRDRDAFVGECKIWKGEAELGRAVDQLMSRYVPWRTARVALLVFIRGSHDPESIITKATAAVRSHPRCRGAYPLSDDGRRRDFDVEVGDLAQVVRLSLIPVVIAAPNSHQSTA